VRRDTLRLYTNQVNACRKIIGKQIKTSLHKGGALKQSANFVKT